jgi:hypothetical protein
MNPIDDQRLAITRRAFFGKAATGVGAAALTSLLRQEGLAAPPTPSPSPTDASVLPGLPHFAPRAKRIIYLFQNGAPTHVDLFDYKPKLAQLHGRPVPDDYIAGKRFSTMTGKADGKLLLAPVEPFRQHGRSGAWVSDFLPHTPPRSPTTCASSKACTPTPSIMRPRFPCFSAAHKSPVAPRWAPG